MKESPPDAKNRSRKCRLESDEASFASASVSSKAKADKPAAAAIVGTRKEAKRRRREYEGENVVG